MLKSSKTIQQVCRKRKVLFVGILLILPLLGFNILSTEVSAATTIPVLLQPFDGQIFTTYRNFLFDWEPCSDGAGSAIDYEIQVSWEPNFAFDIFIVSTGLDSEYYYNTYYDLNDGLFYWRVRAEGFIEGWSSWSEGWNFTIAMYPPDPPTLLYPTNEFMRDNYPSFSWTVSQRPTIPPGIYGQYPGSYDIQVSTAFDFSVLSIDTNVLTNSFTPTSPLPEDEYFWRVRPIGTLGTVGSWTSASNFTIDNTNPDSPYLWSPTNGFLTNNNITVLEWSTIADAKEYNFQLSQNQFFSPPCYNETTTSTNFSVPIELTDSNYFWRVRAVDYVGNIGDWSPTWSFTIDTLPPEFGVITSFPLEPTDRDEITLFCEVWDLGGLDTVTLYYRDVTSGTWLEKTATPYFEDVYTTTIGPFEADTTTEYYFNVVDIFGLDSESAREEVETGSYSDIMSWETSSTSETGYTVFSLCLLISGTFIVLTIFRISKRKKLSSKEIS